MSFDQIKPFILPILVSLFKSSLSAIGYDSTDNQEMAITIAGWVSTGLGILWSIWDNVRISKLKKTVADQSAVIASQPKPQ